MPNHQFSLYLCVKNVYKASKSFTKTVFNLSVLSLLKTRLFINHILCSVFSLVRLFLFHHVLGLVQSVNYWFIHTIHNTNNKDNKFKSIFYRYYIRRLMI